jgi:hypothetical protein
MTDEKDNDTPLSGEMVRDDKGRFVAGKSGNPSGRPKGTKNQITQIRQNTELALREYMSSPDNARKALKVMDVLFEKASDGDVSAIKLLLDKVLPQARAGADENDGEKQKPVAIQIINQTSDKASSPVKITTIDPDGNEVE